MKTIEEKAKAYDEAIEKAVKIHNEHKAQPFDVMLKVFPELAESEDERIRKWIIDDIRYNINNEPLNNSEYKKNAEKAIVWLEAQGEQNTVEWSEEDEKCIRLSTDIIDSALRAGFCVQLDRDRCVDWLKSLKLQRQWKPSNEQIEILVWCIPLFADPKSKCILESLINELKKQKGE